MADSQFPSPYIPNTADEQAAMLQAIGVDSVDDLFQDIPAEFRNPGLNMPAPLSEMEVLQELQRLSERNLYPGRYASFLGAGVYRHFTPSVVSALVSRGEYLTSYTPYQAEISQGRLEALLNFQTLVADLTGMEVVQPRRPLTGAWIETHPDPAQIPCHCGRPLTGAWIETFYL